MDTHESSARFEEHKNRLRPRVGGDTVLFGHAAPFAVKGYNA